MGHKISDGLAIDVTVPAGQYDHGDLFRIGDWNGIMLNTCATADTDRKRSMEVSPATHWKVKFPGALAPAVGAYLYWTAGAGTKRGDTDLAATVVGAPVAKVVEAKNAAGYATIRVLNVGP